MALPLSPSTTYVASTTPSIKAADLNDLQTYLAAIYSRLYSIKALFVDGTGGTSESAPGADTPLAIFADKLGNPRSWFDHNGLPMGRISVIQENWGFANSSTNTNIVCADPRWSLIFGNGGGSNDISAVAASSTIPAGNLHIVAGTNASDYATIYSSVNCVSAQAYMDIVLEYAFKAATSANVHWRMGLHGAASVLPLANTSSGAYFERLGSDANWHSVTMASTATSRVDTGVAYEGTNVHRFRIEIHGDLTAYGGVGVVRFFIDEVLVVTETTVVPNNTMGMFCSGQRAGANAIIGILGPMRLVFNQFVDPITAL